MIFHGDCIDMLQQMPYVPLIFADPPDNLGLKYNSYIDKRPDYYDWVETVISESLKKCDCLWWSYYWANDLEIKYRVYKLLKKLPHIKTKTFIWRYTFGQHNQFDFGSGFRFLLRFMKPSARCHPERVQSKRQILGDKRADPRGRIPDDVFDIPRVVGNAKERRAWHVTQHPEALIRQIILAHSDSEDLVADLFGGSGTILRVALAEGRRIIIAEIDESYCQHMSQESGVPIVTQI